jgi:hypothetical protein
MNKYPKIIKTQEKFFNVGTYTIGQRKIEFWQVEEYSYRCIIKKPKHKSEGVFWGIEIISDKISAPSFYINGIKYLDVLSSQEMAYEDALKKLSNQY